MCLVSSGQDAFQVGSPGHLTTANLGQEESDREDDKNSVNSLV